MPGRSTVAVGAVSLWKWASGLVVVGVGGGPVPARTVGHGRSVAVVEELRGVGVEHAQVGPEVDGRGHGDGGSRGVVVQPLEVVHEVGDPGAVSGSGSEAVAAGGEA